MGYGHGMRQRRTTPIFREGWRNKVGVFETKWGKWVVRVKTPRGTTTLSQHDTKEEANEVFRKHEM